MGGKHLPRYLEVWCHPRERENRHQNAELGTQKESCPAEPTIAGNCSKRTPTALHSTQGKQAQRFPTYRLFPLSSHQAKATQAAMTYEVSGPMFSATGQGHQKQPAISIWKNVTSLSTQGEVMTTASTRTEDRTVQCGLRCSPLLRRQKRGVRGTNIRMADSVSCPLIPKIRGVSTKSLIPEDGLPPGKTI